MGKIATVYSSAVIGVDSIPVIVEVDVSPGLASCTIVGLADTAIQESRDRIKAAIKNVCNVSIRGKIVVNLAPADIRKVGPLYDLPIALGMLKTQDVVRANFEDMLFVGELSLEGNVRPIKGMLPIAYFAENADFRDLFVPKENVHEAALMQKVNVYGVSTLKECIDHLSGKKKIQPAFIEPQKRVVKNGGVDFKDINGQKVARRALEIAAAGGHNVLLSGSPGAGKTLMARALPSIMPSLDFEEAIEVSRIYSISGLLSPEKPLIAERPFRSPHHSTSGVALVGGGAFPRPGEVSLAHRGVLFLDELPEFDRRALENLRQPMEDGEVHISRAQQTLTFPAQFSLVASMNPCPCGYLGATDRDCKCSDREVEKYQKKLSGPLLDRIDLQIHVTKVAYADLRSQKTNEPSEVIRTRVEAAREIQRQRYRPKFIYSNAEMEKIHLEEFCKLSDASEKMLKDATIHMKLSARSFFKVIKVARTIADLAGSKDVRDEHIAEALQYRMVTD